MTADSSLGLRTLVIDNDPSSANAIRDGLRHSTPHHFQPEFVPSMDSAECLLRKGGIDLVFVSLALSRPSGLEAVRVVQRASPAAAIIAVTASADEPLAMGAIQLGAQDYLVRDELEPALIVRSARYAVERHQLLISLRASEERVRELNVGLERRIAERTRELETSNQELEAFAYSVSHDLRAPLRAIDGFSDLVLKNEGDRLSEGSRAYLLRVRAAAQRMSTLIDDLLELSRISRSEVRVVDVDLVRVGRAIFDELRSEDSGRVVEAVMPPSIPVQADAALIKILLDNLIRNAWKFTGRHKRARIELGMRQEAEPIYFVRDDGAGFNMKYVGKIFSPFQRLHNPDQFEGSGIGLAIVQRIVRRHGGEVWAEASVEQGATFFFTLPSSVR